MHERWSIDVKTLCGELLAEVEKKHRIWEAEVTTALLFKPLVRHFLLNIPGGKKRSSSNLVFPPLYLSWPLVLFACPLSSYHPGEFQQ